jgi:2'-5' RNA ligase
MHYADYLFMLRPPEHVTGQVMAYRQLIIKHAGPFKGMNKGAHITIKDYGRQKTFIMRPAIDTIERKIMGLPPVKLQIDGFHHFNHKESLTIYAKIKPTLVTDKWFDTLTKHLRIPPRSLTPHITIARNISVDVFYRVWPLFKFERYQQEFVADKLWILERETFNIESKYKVYKELAFDGYENKCN